MRRFVEATNRAVVERFIEDVYNLKQVDVVDELVAPTHESNDPALPGIRGPEDVRLVAQMFQETFPDWHESIEDLVVDGDRVAVRLLASGTHQGFFLDIPPTGRRVTIGGMVIYRLRQGQIVEHWAMFDTYGLIRQLGAMPALESAPRPAPSDPGAA